MSEQEVITEVPPQLKQLVHMVARAYYVPVQIVVLDILAKYPCVKEDDLIEVLKLDQKQLRQSLSYLKKDKLIKSLQKMEKLEETVDAKQRIRMVHYYYINYKAFVNAVKYKLDQMREKIENEARKIQGRTAYTCSNCEHEFSDLDVGDLIQPDGDLRCSHCGSAVQEVVPNSSCVDSRAKILQLNEQMSPIVELLRQAENLNLAPEILEPEAQSISKHLQAKGIKSAVKSEEQDQLWSSRKAIDLYGADQAIRVNIGAQEEHKKEKPIPKERPDWMKYSTVHPAEDIADQTPLQPVGTTARKLKTADHQIIAELLEHEAAAVQLPTGARGAGGAGAGPSNKHHLPESVYSSSSSSSSEEEEEEDSVSVPAMQENSPSNSDDEEDFTMMIGGRTVPLDEITEEMVKQMTQDERVTYTKLCQQAFNDYY